jgi:plasmid stabilization system protein ParE
VKPVRFHPDADAEFIDAILYHANKAARLGERFHAEIRRMTVEIETAPRLHPMWRHRTRRIVGKRFPYAVVYVEQADHLLVLAVAHSKRHPDYWLKRKS